VTVGAVIPVAAPGRTDISPVHPIGGVPMIVHVVRALIAVLTGPCVVVTDSHVDDVPAVLGAHLPAAPGLRVVSVAAADRKAMIALGLAVLETDVVAVQDANRPLVPAEVITRVVEAVRSGADAAVPVVPVTDTVKQVDEHGRVIATLPREQLREIQGPRAFRRDVLLAVLRGSDDLAGPAAEVAAVRCSGGKVQAVGGAAEAFAVRHAVDVIRAEALLAERRTPSPNQARDAGWPAGGLGGVR
jgi:2-C-methyl-D-erythritol 4-phosphate cytidylyltransferase